MRWTLTARRFLTLRLEISTPPHFPDRLIRANLKGAVRPMKH